MSKSTKTVSRIGFIIVLLILIMPIVRYYNVPGTDIGSNSAITLALFLLATIAVLFNNRYISTSNIALLRQSRNYFIFFSIWSVIITLYYEYGGLASGNFNNAIVALLTSFVLIMLMTNKIDTTSIFKIYTLLVYVVLIVLLIQWALSIAGLAIDFRLPLHQFNGSWNFADGTVFGMDGVNTSIFSEPAHLSEFLMPFLCYSLFGTNNKSKRGMQMAIITTIAIVLTMSGTGIVLLGIIWLLFFTIFSEKKGSNKIIIGVIGVIVLVGLFIFLQALEDYNAMLGKLFFSSNGSMEGNKASFRVYRGWDYVSKMPFEYLLTGVGFVHMEKFASLHGLWSIFDNEFKMFEWFSAITEVLLYFGLIGFIPFVLHIHKLYKRQSDLTKSLVILFWALLFTSQILFQETHFFYLVLIIGSIQLSDKSYEHKRDIAIL